MILYSREAHIHGESPGILYGYGAYGEDLDKSWCSDRLSLLARGWVLAFADVRYSLMPVAFFQLTGLHFPIIIQYFLTHLTTYCSMRNSAFLFGKLDYLRTRLAYLHPILGLPTSVQHDVFIHQIL